MYKSYKYRIYPNPQQKEMIQKTFGCTRYVFNYFLNKNIELRKDGGKHLSKIDCSRYLQTTLKKEFDWLKEPDSQALVGACFQVEDAYQRFFKKQSGFPKFKSKKNDVKSYTTYKNNAENMVMDFDNDRIFLPKLKWVKASISKKFEGQLKQATISYTASGKYFVAMKFVTSEPTPLPVVDKNIGIDLGLKEFLTTSNGDVVDNPKTLRRYEHNLATQQRKLSSKQKGSNNYRKQKKRVAKVYEKIKNTRLDFLHKLSTKIIRENQTIIAEDLSVKDMMEDCYWAKDIGDVSWYEFMRQLKYKAEWHGRVFHQIERYFPSSQLCSTCGYQNTETKDLSVRNWICHSCGTEHNRDYNAAKNILKQGLKELAA